jgi:outer membrane protein OmpA-like peptidoglycan-associated protein
MQRRTFIIGAAGLAAAPAVALAEAGWSPPLIIRFAPGSAEIDRHAVGQLEGFKAAFEARANPRNGDSIRVTGHMDEAERRQNLRDLPQQRADAVVEALADLGMQRGRARARRSLDRLVDVAGPSADNRVVLLSWRVSS